MARRLTIQIVVLALLAASGLEFSWYMNVRQLDRDRRAARAMQIGLNAQFMGNPRFAHVWVTGFSGRAHVFSVEESFSVTGWVHSKKDFADAWRTIVALHPPGELKYVLAIRAPPTRPRTVARSTPKAKTPNPKR
jgi:hypothetical protein